MVAESRTGRGLESSLSLLISEETSLFVYTHQLLDALLRMK